MTNAGDPWTEKAEKFGEHLKQLRMQAGLSQEALGNKIGRAKSSICRYELGAFSKPPERDLVAKWVAECKSQIEKGRGLLAPRPPVRPVRPAAEWWETDLKNLQRLREDQTRGRQQGVDGVPAAPVPHRAAGLLADYLKSARRGAEEHPYRGIQYGDAPPLPTVYVHQYARLRTSEAAPGRVSPQRDDSQMGPRVPAGEALTGGGPVCTVLGAPGDGKSSLLRWHLAAAISALDERAEEVEVPVLLPAVELADGARLEEALASYTNRSLRPGLSQDLHADFFAARPSPGTSWLVLVDGLDEVVDVEQRRKVLNTISATLADRKGGYRFVVTSRPLPEAELNALGRQAPRYELEPFTTHDLPVFAESWFTAQQIPDPAGLTERFIFTLQGMGVADLARSPLMATMLCQLFADRPHEPLPASRGVIYGRFADLLQMRQYQNTPENQAHQTLSKYGEAAIEQGKSVIEAFPRLVRYLAHQRHSGNLKSALRILAENPDTQRPVTVPQLVWEGFIASCLRGSGAIVPHAGDFNFLHQTFLEYFAAYHVIHDQEGRGPRSFSSLFDDPEVAQLPSAGSASKSDAWGRAYWELVRLGASYIGFLLDVLPEEDTSHVFTSLIEVGAQEGVEIIAGLAQVGTRVPVTITDTAVTKLDGFARDAGSSSWARVHAARTLCDLNAARGTELLTSLARDAGVGIDPAELDDILAGDEDPESVLVDQDDARLTAAEYLVDLGDARGTDCLHSLADNEELHSMFRVQAAKRLADLGDVRTADLLYRLVWDLTLDAPDRIIAAVYLEGLDSQRGVTVLYHLSRDNRFPPFNRLVAAWYLAQFDEGSIADLLDDLAGDISLPPDHRLKAAQWLSGLGDRGRADRYIDDLPPDTDVGSLDSDLPELQLGRRRVRRNEEF